MKYTVSYRESKSDATILHFTFESIFDEMYMGGCEFLTEMAAAVKENVRYKKSFCNYFEIGDQNIFITDENGREFGINDFAFDYMMARI